MINTNKRFKQLLLLLLIFVNAVLSGCDTHKESILRLGTNAWLGYEPLYLAKQLGYWSTKQVRLVEFLSSTETLRALRNNEIDAVALTLDEILLLLQDGIELHIILVTDISLGGDVIIGRADIGSIKDLAGKRVAVESGALGAYMLTRALELQGLTLADVEVIHQTANEHVHTFDNDVAEAVIGCEPERSFLLKKGAHILFDSGDIPGEVVDVIAVRTAYLQQNPSAVEKLLRGWFTAIDFLRSNTDQATSIMSQRMQLSQDEVAASLAGLKIPTYQENIELLGGDTPAVLGTMRKLNSVMMSNQLINSIVDISSLATAGPLMKLNQDKNLLVDSSQ